MLHAHRYRIFSLSAQYRGDGIASRGAGYGMHTIRVDGSDVLAVLTAMRQARLIASGADGTGRTKPVLIEAMTYREGHHSTSDDSTRYRSAEEVTAWRDHSNPVRRLRRYLERLSWWSQEKEDALQVRAQLAMLQ
jgi:2-oxoisovalerate dehydrogenase E1 component alpha subunit